MKTQQKGFTLIELIIVIVVLGILAVTAAPQFFNFSSDARASTVKGMEGSVKAASALVYAKALLAPAGTTSVVVDQYGTSVTLTADTQYAAATDPATDPAGITAALDMSDFSVVVAGASVDTEADAAGVEENDLLIFPTGFGVDATAAPLCYVVYRAAVVADAGPPVVAAAAPTIFSVTSGC
ncbi:type II secretion system protein [Pseudidiomarina fusca]|uniref:type II secretion system protein n=1 Tax=Pseudidiomarina fusca TaxID=2965078 RepID=UPI0028C4D460|nr:prepilin-type N-terminal cleavage/methylation domain-containing protein [Pseudidiomarina sp. GXY010]